MTLEQLEKVIKKLTKCNLRNKIKKPDLYFKNLSDHEIENIISMNIGSIELPSSEYTKIFEEWVKLPLNELNYLICVLERYYTIRKRCCSETKIDLMDAGVVIMYPLCELSNSLTNIILSGYSKNKDTVTKNVELILKKFDVLLKSYDENLVNLDTVNAELNIMLYMCDIAMNSNLLKQKKLHQKVMQLLYDSKNEKNCKKVRDFIIDFNVSINQKNYKNYINCLKILLDGDIPSKILDNSLELLSRLTFENQDEIFELAKLTGMANSEHISDNLLNAINRFDNDFKDNKEYEINKLECIKYIANAKSDIISDCLVNVMFHLESILSGYQLERMKKISNLTDKEAVSFSNMLLFGNTENYDDMDKILFNAKLYVAENDDVNVLPDSVFSIKKNKNNSN